MDWNDLVFWVENESERKYPLRRTSAMEQLYSKNRNGKEFKPAVGDHILLKNDYPYDFANNIHHSVLWLQNEDQRTPDDFDLMTEVLVDGINPIKYVWN